MVERVVCPPHVSALHARTLHTHTWLMACNSLGLGEAYLLRQALAKAKKLIETQEDWCSAAENLSLSSTENDIYLDSHFPEDVKLESLTALLRGQVKLNIHCYETHDIEAMLRHAEEFNFNISAFHHALEAYKIPEILKRAHNNITIATFADHWGYKKEAYGASPRAPRYLYEAGIPVALKSDHPVLNSQHMAFEAAKATHYGLPPQEAFKSITSVPANALGLGHRVGSLRVGYDADVVIWDKSPLALGAAPLQVFVDGIPLFDEKPIAPVKKDSAQSAITQQKVAQLPREGLRNFALTNVGSNLVSQSKTVIVQDGKIVCSAREEECQSVLMQSGLETIDVKGGYVLPVSCSVNLFKFTDTNANPGLDCCGIKIRHGGDALGRFHWRWCCAVLVLAESKINCWGSGWIETGVEKTRRSLQGRRSDDHQLTHFKKHCHGRKYCF